MKVEVSADRNRIDTAMDLSESPLSHRPRSYYPSMPWAASGPSREYPRGAFGNLVAEKIGFFSVSSNTVISVREHATTAEDLLRMEPRRGRDALTDAGTEARRLQGSEITIYTYAETVKSFADRLKTIDAAQYDAVVVQMAEKMSPDGKRQLSRSLRSPKNTIGALKNHPMWQEVNEALERNRRAEETEVDAE